MKINPKLNVNVEGLVDSYKKNLDTISTATKVATETLQTISQLQTRYMRESFEELGGVIRELMAATPETRTNLSQKAVQQGVSRAMSHGSVMAQALSRSSTEVMGLFGQRLGEGMQSTKSMFKQPAESEEKSEATSGSKNSKSKTSASASGYATATGYKGASGA